MHFQFLGLTFVLLGFLQLWEFFWNYPRQKTHLIHRRRRQSFELKQQSTNKKKQKNKNKKTHAKFLNFVVTFFERVVTHLLRVMRMQ